MAGYRQFHTQFWKDEWLIDLEPLERYLFSYLFTNDLSSISGIFKLPMRVIQNETGLDKDFISNSMKKFQDAKKIFYQEGVLWVVNMHKYHKNASPRTMVKVNADVREIPDGPVKTAYLYYEKTGIYSIDIVSILRSESVIVSVIESVSESGSKGDNNGVDGVLDTDYAELTTAYENNIGVLSQTIGEILEADLQEYGLGPCKDAITEAVKANVRKWSYCQAILKRWKKDGRTFQPQKGTAQSGTVEIVLPGGEITEART